MKMRNLCAALGVAALVVSGLGAASAAPGKGKDGAPKRPAKPVKKVVLNGVVLSVAGDAAAPTSFVLKRRGGKGGGKNGLRVTVVLSEQTKYRKTDASAASAADVVADARVQVKGTANKDGSVAAAQVLVKVPEPEDDNGGTE